MSETEREAIIDGEGDNKLVSVVESVDEVGVYGIVLLDPDGNDI